MAKRKKAEQSEEDRAEARRPRGRARAAEEARQRRRVETGRYIVQCPICRIPEVVERPGGKCDEHGEVMAIVGHRG